MIKIAAVEDGEIILADEIVVIKEKRFFSDRRN